MPPHVHKALALTAVLALSLGFDTCAGQVASPADEVVTPSDVLASPAAFLGSSIRVRGRVHLVREDTLGPCIQTTGSGCITPTAASLQLVTVGESTSGTTALDLYRAAEQGAEEPLKCRVIATNQFDCGALTPDSVAVVAGRVLRHRIPAQQVKTSTGEIQVVRYREIYVLLIR